MHKNIDKHNTKIFIKNNIKYIGVYYTLLRPCNVAKFPDAIMVEICKGLNVY